jgi:hypothetical protein
METVCKIFKAVYVYIIIISRETVYSDTILFHIK